MIKVYPIRPREHFVERERRSDLLAICAGKRRLSPRALAQDPLLVGVILLATSLGLTCPTLTKDIAADLCAQLSHYT